MWRLPKNTPSPTIPAMRDTKNPSDFDVLYYSASFGCRPSQMFSGERIREVECPSCQAKPGFSCVGVAVNKKLLKSLFSIFCVIPSQ